MLRSVQPNAVEKGSTEHAALVSCDHVFGDELGSLTAESPASPSAIAGGSEGSLGEWRATARAWWGIIAQSIDQHVSPAWRSAAKIAVAVYPFFALVLLLFPGYRKLPKELLIGMDRRAQAPDECDTSNRAVGKGGGDTHH